MRMLFVFILMWLPLAGHTATSEAGLFAMIKAKDVGGVTVALNAAIAEDRKGDGKSDQQRELFAFFMNSHPAISDFTTGWIEKEPDNPLALSARAWHLYGMGWIMRGNDFANRTSSEAFQKMRQLHQSAFDLFEKAIAAMPDLPAASDGHLVLAMTMGNIALAPVELERIMAVRPNRGSLMRAMGAVAPQWGGDMEQVVLLCDRYAPMVPTPADYSTEVCQIDAVYFANFPDGPVRDIAHERLIDSIHPVLDYARLEAAVDGKGPLGWRRFVLEQQMQKEPLTVKEASAYDFVLATLMIPNGLSGDTTYFKALPDEVTRTREQADYDPLNARTVTRYMDALHDYTDTLLFEDPKRAALLDYPDIGRRMELVLSANPASGSAWLYLAQAHVGQGDLSGIRTAMPYFENAVFYSGHDPKVVEAAAFALTPWVIASPYDPQLLDISGLSAAELAETDRVVHCPLARMLILSALVCSYRGINMASCAGGLVENDVVMKRLFAAHERQPCPALNASMQENEIVAPVDVDLNRFQP